jgi:ribosomal protein S18 acetylase RimI-like enzyme
MKRIPYIIEIANDRCVCFSSNTQDILGYVEFCDIKTMNTFFDCIGGYIKLTDLSYLNIPCNDLCVISDLYVEKYFRGNGVGKLLMDYVSRRNKNYVLMANTKGSKTLPDFYKKLGFEVLFETRYGPMMIKRKKRLFSIF